MTDELKMVWIEMSRLGKSKVFPCPPMDVLIGDIFSQIGGIRGWKRKKTPDPGVF